MKIRPVPSAPQCCRTMNNARADEPPSSAPSMTPLLLLLLIVIECARPCRSTVARTKPHRYLVLQQTTHVTPRPFPTTITGSRKLAAIMPRDFALPNHRPGRMRPAGDCATSRGMCRQCHIFFLNNQPSEVVCVRQIIT